MQSFEMSSMLINFSKPRMKECMNERKLLIIHHRIQQSKNRGIGIVKHGYIKCKMIQMAEYDWKNQQSNQQYVR